MTAQWALELAGETIEVPLWGVAEEVVGRYGEGATRPDEHPDLSTLAYELSVGEPIERIEGLLRGLSHAGFLRGALVVMASSLHQRPRADVAIALARELMDALAPDLGVRLCRAALARPEAQQGWRADGGAFFSGNLLLGQAMLDTGDAAAAMRHFEAVLSVDVDHARALAGWSEASRALERQGITPEHRSRGLALLDGVEDLELSDALAGDRYELQRPLGRGRHAVVYQAYDRRVGREVALKRLLEPDARRGGVPPRVLEARFFSEARTLARVRSPYVVALYDVQPRRRFIAMTLCRGGNLRLALRRGLVGPKDMPRIGKQLASALDAVHAAGAVHRDVKPANILVRAPVRGAPIALADFGLAVAVDPDKTRAGAGTLRYLAPELRRGAARPTPQSDRFSAGVALLELATAPQPLPAALDRLDDALDARSHVPRDLDDPWRERLERLLHPDPEARTW